MYQPQQNELVNLFKMAASQKNPQQFLQQIISQSPQYQNVYRLIQNHGGDPRTAFYELARERGVDPDSILNMFK